MDASFYLVMYGFIFVIGLLLAVAAWTYFRRFQKLSTTLKRSGEMTATANGTIKELVSIRRRNRSFRWTNQYPIVSYTVNGREYTAKLDYAEQRSGYYTTGGSYPVSYVPSEPECCIVEEFRKKMERAKKSNLIAMVVFGILVCNILASCVINLVKLI